MALITNKKPQTKVFQKGYPWSHLDMAQQTVQEMIEGILNLKLMQFETSVWPESSPKNCMTSSAHSREFETYVSPALKCEKANCFCSTA